MAQWLRFLPNEQREYCFPSIDSSLVVAIMGLFDKGNHMGVCEILCIILNIMEKNMW